MLSNRLREAMAKKGLGPVALAKASGVHRTTISHILNGRRLHFSREAGPAIRAVLGRRLSLEELLGVESRGAR